ncbi:MAG: COX15/CtaA family protein [Maricaulaceae bacterium]
MAKAKPAADPPSADFGFIAWLALVTLLILVMILVGGATRLTDSGLSITEWKPLSGAVPPLSDAAWAEAFAKYRTTTEYQTQNRGMSLEAFQVIFWWEWGHRQLGRLIGLVFALGLAGFWLARRIPKGFPVRLVVLFGLGGLQGFVGWWMVSSGLADRLDVAPERLATHLSLAFILFGVMVWTLADAVTGAVRRPRPEGPWRASALMVLALAFLQIALGALAAGLDAGKIYVDWPLMAGGFTPPGYGEAALVDQALNDRGAAQFHHRLGAYALLVAVSVFWAFAERGRLPSPVLAPTRVLVVAVWLQAALGVVALMNAAPLGLSLAHQAGGAVCFAAAVLVARACWRGYEATAALSARETASSAVTATAPSP